MNLFRLDRRGQSFIEFCVISGLILGAVLLFGPTMAAKVRQLMQSFLNKV